MTTADITPHAGIDALYEAWKGAFARKDVEAVLDLLTDDYELYAPGTPPVGREALRAPLAAAFGAYDVVPAYECEERIVSGDVAFERGWDIQHVTPRGGGASQTRKQRVFLLLRESSDGRWRFARGMSQPGPAE